VLKNPLASQARKDVALRVRQTFLPALSYLTLPHADEVLNAKKNRDHLPEMKTDLESFKVEDQSLYEVVVAFLDAGDTRGKLLSQQASQEAASATDRTEAARLRPKVIGLLGNLRGAMLDEVTHTPTLPPNLEAQVFGLLDDTLQKRVASNQEAARTRARKKDEAQTKAAREAKQRAALAKVEAEEKAKEAQAAQDAAAKAQAEADEK
jgi:hypothetical protein